MRRINAEIQGGKVQEYWRISSLSDAEVQYLDEQKIHDLVGGSITFHIKSLKRDMSCEVTRPAERLY